MSLYEERLALARQICDAVVARHGDKIVAVGLHGSMAHGDVDEYSDIDFLVVVDERGAIPERSAWSDGLYVSVSVNTVDVLLGDARAVESMWSAAADQYLNPLALHDPSGFFERLRKAHIEGSDDPHAFTTCAAGTLFDAFEAISKARRYVAQRAMPAASVCLSESLVTMGLVVGLLTRSRWRGTHDAVANAAQAGRSIDGFSDAYVAATDDARTAGSRIESAAVAAGRLRDHLEAMGQRFEAASVVELVD
jgi:predicted nucleotidyltransferase